MKHSILSLFLAFAAATPMVAQVYSAPPPQAEPWVHDPVMAHEGDIYHLYCTGQGLKHYTSTDLKMWTSDPTPVISLIPQWATDSVPGFTTHVWAPDIVRYRDRWYMSYSCSTFGKNTSAIGLMSRKSLNDDQPWQDHGCLVNSRKDRNNWNAIDPNFVVDADGNPWLTWGSFWDGIQLVPLDTTLHVKSGAEPVTIARRYGDAAERRKTFPASDEAGPNAIEAPFIYQRGGWYYLFVSWDYCCQGEKSTYRVAVGRSRSVEGPYVDREGKKMTDGGGTILIEGDKKEFEAIGHCSVYDLPDGTTRYFSHGYSLKQHGSPILVQRLVKWDNAEWPVLSKID